MYIICFSVIHNSAINLLKKKVTWVNQKSTTRVGKWQRVWQILLWVFKRAFGLTPCSPLTDILTCSNSRTSIFDLGKHFNKSISFLLSSFPSNPFSHSFNPCTSFLSHTDTYTHTDTHTHTHTGWEVYYSKLQTPTTLDMLSDHHTSDVTVSHTQPSQSL